MSTEEGRSDPGSNSNMEFTDKLEVLQDKLVDRFIEKVEDPSCKAADLTAMVQFLRSHGVTLEQLRAFRNQAEATQRALEDLPDYSGDASFDFLDEEPPPS